MIVWNKVEKQQAVDLRLKQPIYKHWILAMVLLLSISGVSNVLASSDLMMEKVYHIYLEEEFIGTVDDEEDYLGFLNELLEEEQERHFGLTFDFKETIDVIPELVFIPNANTEQTKEKLAELLTVKAVATALVIEEDEVVYLAEQEAVAQLKKQMVLEQVEEEAFEEYVLSLQEEGSLKVNEEEVARKLPSSESGEREPVHTNEMNDKEIGLELEEKLINSVSFTTDIESKQVLVSPEKVSTVEEAFEEIEQGKENEFYYEVKEGDVLGTIASELNLSIKELLAFNEDLNKESVIRAGDKLQIKTLEPYLEIEVVEHSKVEEELDFDIEVKEDSNLFKGEEKVERKGIPGLQHVEYKTVRLNGEMVEQEVLNQQVIEEPVSEVVRKGTKERSELAWPADGGYISSHQGKRWGSYHKGIDIARPSSYSIYAAESGTVTAVTSGGGYGNYIRIRHDNGLETLYAHLKSTSVQVGQSVTRGQQIGVMGSTGDSTGIHLHFEVTRGGSLLNPMDYLP
ncbi:peptidoglycan DD-metalloendopeptidase family protein [Alkalihalobacillus sp. 1P02AB]|uniref:peptidoglycan DD-metalloendopeptidase family protein n=1 Tax=Alkalihalobacillus sp. 1P02AB TaxID=3132260 RepID=UPI0039A6831A